MKLDKADKVFSQVIRLRDKECKRCHSLVQFNEKGLPITHQASHYFGRASESTRFEMDNVDTLCGACHRYWGSDERESYRNFKIKQLGENGFKLLTIQSKTYKKKDRAMEYIKAKVILKDLLENT